MTESVNPAPAPRMNATFLPVPNKDNELIVSDMRGGERRGEEGRGGERMGEEGRGGERRGEERVDRI